MKEMPKIVKLLKKGKCNLQEQFDKHITDNLTLEANKLNLTFDFRPILKEVDDYKKYLETLKTAIEKEFDKLHAIVKLQSKQLKEQDRRLIHLETFERRVKKGGWR